MFTEIHQLRWSGVAIASCSDGARERACVSVEGPYDMGRATERRSEGRDVAAAPDTPRSAAEGHMGTAIELSDVTGPRWFRDRRWRAFLNQRWVGSSARRRG